jgi:hypothetical protein
LPRYERRRPHQTVGTWWGRRRSHAVARRPALQSPGRRAGSRECPGHRAGSPRAREPWAPNCLSPRLCDHRRQHQRQHGEADRRARCGNGPAATAPALSDLTTSDPTLQAGQKAQVPRTSSRHAEPARQWRHRRLRAPREWSSEGERPSEDRQRKDACQESRASHGARRPPNLLSLGLGWPFPVVAAASGHVRRSGRFCGSPRPAFLCASRSEK